VTKINEVITEKPFPNSGFIRRLWTLGRLEFTLVVNTFLVLIIIIIIYIL